MKLFVTLNKRNLAIILCVLIIGFLLMGEFLTAGRKGIDGSTNALRIAYLKSLKIEPDDSEVTSKSIIIPEKFGDVYANYNSIQKKAGFDLSRYKGKEATLYTYALLGENDMQIHLIVLNGNIIGGDIASVKLNGEIKPLR